MRVTRAPVPRQAGKKLKAQRRQRVVQVSDTIPMLSFRLVSEPGYVALLESGELEERVERLYALLRACTVCPRDCGNDRLAGVLASCASAERPIVSAYAPHFGEEPTLTGTRGAGNIFFGNCNLRCVYCQNYQISQDYTTQKTNEIS